MIVVETKMQEIPISCKECELKVLTPGMIMCPVLRDWLEPFEIKNGKLKLDNCPLKIKL